MNNGIPPRIDGISETGITGPLGVSESRERRDKDKPEQTEKTQTNVSDSVKFSDTARFISIVQQEIANMDEQEKFGFSDDQKKKIAELKERIASGTYQIDSNSIAKSILMDEFSIDK